jgi:hypothetical protein
VEGACRGNEGENWKQGGLAGCRVSDELKLVWIKWFPLRYAAALNFFSLPNSLALYAGEYDTPDRFASVRLSGRGCRYSMALVGRWHRLSWLSLQLARTVRWNDPGRSGDLEVYVSSSFYLERIGSN